MWDNECGICCADCQDLKPIRYKYCKRDCLSQENDCDKCKHGKKTDEQ